MTFFKQFLSGRTHAAFNSNAAAMANFSYAIGCEETKQCYLVDPTWAPLELAKNIESEGYILSGVIATHYHFDHIGGEAYGIHVPGVMELLKEYNVPLYCHTLEKRWIEKKLGTSSLPIKTVEDKETIAVGNVSVTVLHTPGHSPGGICLIVDGKLLAGDTLFQEGCGRTDIDGGDTDTLLKTLRDVILPLPDSLQVFSGHNYGSQPSMLLGKIKQTNYIFNM